MTQFELPRQPKVLPDYGPVNKFDIQQSIETALDNLINPEGSVKPEVERAIAVSTGLGLQALDNTVEFEESIEGTERGSWFTRVKESVQRKKASFMTSALITGAVGSWLFEIGPANEKVRADVATELLENGNGALTAGLAVGAITYAVESVAGILSAKSINKKDGILGRFNNFLFKQAEEQNLEVEDKDGHRKSDTLLGLGGGSTLVVIERLRRNPERTYADSRKTALAASAGIAAFSGALTGVAGDLIDWSIENNYYVQGDAMIQTLQDWRTWVGLFAGLQIGPQLSKLTAKLNKDQAANTDTELPDNVVNIRPPITPDPEAWDELDGAVRHRENIKMAAKVAAGIGFVALHGPNELAHLVDNLAITHDVGGWLADSEAIDTAEDYASVMWDWRIYAAGFGALLAGNKLANSSQDHPITQ